MMTMVMMMTMRRSGETRGGTHSACGAWHPDDDGDDVDDDDDNHDDDDDDDDDTKNKIR